MKDDGPQVSVWIEIENRSLSHWGHWIGTPMALGILQSTFVREVSVESQEE